MTRLFAGVDLGGTRVRAALATATGEIVRRVEALTDRSYIADQVCRLAAEAIGGEQVDCIAVGAPGPLDARTGVLYHPVNLTPDDLPLKELLERRFGIVTHVQNDANAAALGEWMFGGHRPTEHLLYITVSTGVGAGIISHGRLIDGFNTTAGELGHTMIDPLGPECPCGNRGCVEAICSGTSIARAAREALRSGSASSMLALAGGDVEQVTAELVVAAANAGDDLAAGVFFHAADTLGAAVVNAIHMLSPEIVLIGGGVSQAGELLFGPVRARVRRKAMALTARGVSVGPAALGADAGLVGAIALAIVESKK